MVQLVRYSSLAVGVYCQVALVAGVLKAQDTFSLVAVDTITREVVSAGASCIDGDAAPGGALIVSTLLPGRGALHTQSFYSAANQQVGAQLLALGTPAPALLDSLVRQDPAGLGAFRQYAAIGFGAATTGRSTITAAAFTGKSCAPWAGHWIGEQVVMAGNILLDSTIVASMRTAYQTAEAQQLWLAERAMLALEAAAVPGADRRCLAAGLSSRSAFLRLGRPTDAAGSLTLDLSIAYPHDGVDPVVLLRNAFDEWVAASSTR